MNAFAQLLGFISPKARLRRQRGSFIHEPGWPESGCCIFSGKAEPRHAAAVGWCSS